MCNKESQINQRTDIVVEAEKSAAKFFESQNSTWEDHDIVIETDLYRLS